MCGEKFLPHILSNFVSLSYQTINMDRYIVDLISFQINIEFISNIYETATAINKYKTSNGLSTVW